MKLLLFVAALLVRLRPCPRPPVSHEGSDWPGLKAMEENMQSIRATFTIAAKGETNSRPVFSVFWLMVWAIAILDDSDRSREREHAPGNKPS